MFTRIKPNECGPVRLSTGWVDRSRPSCAANCRNRYSERCISFLYNESSNLCMPSSGLSTSHPQQSLDEGDLYYHQYPRFSKFTFGLVTVEAAYMTQPLVYSDAVAACKCLGAYLYSPDNWDKIAIIELAAVPRYDMWIGLDDVTNEGQFVWANSGQKMDVKYSSTVFKMGQPDDGHASANQDCILIAPDSLLFDDVECFYPKAYICERPM